MGSPSFLLRNRECEDPGALVLRIVVHALESRLHLEVN